VVRRVYDFWNRGEFEAAVRMLDPRVLWRGYSHLPEAGPREGIGEVRRWADAFREAWGEIQVRVERLIDVDDQSVLALVRMMGRGRGSAPPWSPDSMATSGPCARVVWWQSTCTKAQGAPSKPWGCGSSRCRMRHGNEKGAPEDALRATYYVLKEGHARGWSRAGASRTKLPAQAVLARSRMAIAVAVTVARPVIPTRERIT
jgi:SnoaL-like domain